MALETTAKALALWTLILLLAIANGLLREAVLIPRIGAFATFVSGAKLLGQLPQWKRTHLSSSSA